MRKQIPAVLCVTMAMTLLATAQQPKISNAQVSVREGAGLQATVTAAQPATWIGYSVPVAHPFHSGWNDSVAYLEDGHHDEMKYERKPGDPVPRANIYLRVTAGRVEKVRVEDIDRAIDGGGLPVVWLGALKPQESIAVLAGVVESAAKFLPAGTDRATKEQASARSLLDSSMVTIALADTPESVATLTRFTAPTYALTIRDKAAFWLANEKERAGFDVVSRLLREDKDDQLRRKLVFDLTLVRGEASKAAVDELLAVARSDRSTQVQSQAQFWLAQIASRKLEGDPRIAATLSKSAEGEAAIAKSAVFALSRMPADQGIPELIHVASTSSNLTTRKEAIFWLGQSKDARALAYIEKVARE